MNDWRCDRCHKSGTAPQGSRIHFHRCDPPPTRPRRRFTIDDLADPDDDHLFSLSDRRAAVFQRFLEGDT